MAIGDENKATNTVFLTVNNDNSRQILKNTWSIMIKQHLYIIAPTTVSAKDLMDCEKFYRFDPVHSMEKVIEVLTLHKSMHAFHQTDEKIIVEFKAAGDLYNTCAYPIYFADFQIRGTPRSTDWIMRDDKLKKSHSKRPLHNIPFSHRSNDDIDISLPITTNTQLDLTNRLQESSNMTISEKRIISSKLAITYNRSSKTGSNRISLKFNRFSPFSSAKRNLEEVMPKLTAIQGNPGNDSNILVPNISPDHPYMSDTNDSCLQDIYTFINRTARQFTNNTINPYVSTRITSHNINEILTFLQKLDVLLTWASNKHINNLLAI
ncbi:unnamed protein product [Rhizophagus irregularis]|nr:unnamed protein product [Rhizophagus irregularis]